MRIEISLAIAMVLNIAAASVGPASAQDYDLDAAYGDYEISAAGQSHSVELTAGGTIDPSKLGAECEGWIADAPDAQLHLLSTGAPLSFRVVGDFDSTLVVSESSGDWLCDDDSGGDSQAAITIENPDAGYYDVWVGVYDGSETYHTATLTISQGANAPAMAVASARAAPSAPVVQDREQNIAQCDSNNNPEIAIGSCTALIESGQETDEVLAVAFFVRGISYDNKQDYDRAIQDYSEVIRLDPNDARAFYARGNAYRDKQDYDRAIQDYNEAIRLDPNHSYVFTNRGNVYFYKQDYDRAIQDYNEAIRLDPNYANAFYNRGNAYYRKQDYDRAIQDFDEAIRLDPSNSAAAESRALAVSLQ
jgi:tetratricopeptide (TPR) repeat protein